MSTDTRPMRREKDRMPPAECEKLLREAEVVRLGFSDGEGPYVVPVNFGYAEGRLYVHGALEGRRIDAAASGARVCFEVDACEVVPAQRPCGWTARFQSVIGYGSMRLLGQDEEKLHGLDVIMRHYGSSGEGIGADKLAITSVVEIEIEMMEGKWHLAAPPVEGD